MKKLLAALIAGSFAFAGVAIAQDKKAAAEPKKPTAEECKKAADAKKELAGCEKAKK
jgi:hypothetical protein